MTYMLDFVAFYQLYFWQKQGKKMIDVYDSETLIKVYRLLNKKCEAIDKFILNHATYFGPVTAEYDATDVYNNIIDLMAKKNQLINIKIIIDNAMSKLAEADKKVLFLKMHYNLQMAEICGILELKERTAFRRIEHAFESFADMLNRSKYLLKLEKFLQEDWIASIREDIKSRRLSFCRTASL